MTSSFRHFKAGLSLMQDSGGIESSRVPPLSCLLCSNHRVVHYCECRRALGCTLPPEWLVSSTVYLIYYLIGNLSYTSSSEPSLTVLLLDVMYTTDPHQRSAPYYNSSMFSTFPSYNPRQVDNFVHHRRWIYIHT